MTLKNFRARYHNGVLEPLEDIDLSEDQEVVLTLDDHKQPPSDKGGLARSAGVWADMFDDHEQFIRDIYQARIDGTRPPRHL